MFYPTMFAVALVMLPVLGFFVARRRGWRLGVPQSVRGWKRTALVVACVYLWYAGAVQGALYFSSRGEWVKAVSLPLLMLLLFGTLGAFNVAHASATDRIAARLTARSARVALVAGFVVMAALLAALAWVRAPH